MPATSASDGRPDTPEEAGPDPAASDEPVPAPIPDDTAGDAADGTADASGDTPAGATEDARKDAPRDVPRDGTEGGTTDSAAEDATAGTGPNEPTEATEPSAATEPAAAAQAGTPTEPGTPTEAGEPAEATVPVGAAEPAESDGSAGSVEAPGSAKSEEPAGADDSTEAVDPLKSAEAVESVEATERDEHARTSRSSGASNSEEDAAVPEVVTAPERPAEDANVTRLDNAVMPDDVVTSDDAARHGGTNPNDATRLDMVAPEVVAAADAAGAPGDEGGPAVTLAMNTVPEGEEPRGRGFRRRRSGDAPGGKRSGGGSRGGSDGGPGSPGGPGGTGPGGKAPKKRRSRRVRYLRRACYALGVLILIPITGFIVIYLMTPIPSSAQPTAKAQQSVFYYNDGKTVIGRTGDYDRRPVKLDEVPKPVRDAVISAENRTFYSDPGVSFKGSMRAVVATLSGGSTQGGSTITQQMVRNYYSGLSQKRTVSRKLKEIMIALKVGREKDKDWILQQYLNTIYFGRDAYGIEAAAQAYYHKDVKDLTPAEGAYLAAAIQVPSYAADPSDPGALSYMTARWHYVVNGMVQMKSISPQQAAALKFPTPKKERHKDALAGDKGYMLSLAKAELHRMGYTDNQINMGGLKVRTTFDKSLMQDARQAVLDNMPSGTSKKVLTGLVSVDPSNGEINAFYGGKNYLDRQLNAAFDPQPVGSGFKPYVLATALANGMSLDDYVDGSSPQSFAGKELHNDNNENFGEVNLVTATQDSINTAYLNIGQQVGLSKVVSMAEKLGIPAAQLDPHKDAPTLVLGVASISVEQQAAAYAAFASEGVYHAPHVIRSVKDEDGHVREGDTAGKRVFSKTVARDATYAMQRVVDAGTGTNAALPDRDAAGKTGTTSSGKQIWFNGFIPQLATSVGIFRTDDKPLSIPGYSSYGGDLPARIWRSYLVDADRDMPVKSFGSPSIEVGGGLPPSNVPQPSQPRSTVQRPPVVVPSQPTEPSPNPPAGGGGGPTEPPNPPPTDQPTGGPPRSQTRLYPGYAGTSG